MTYPLDNALLRMDRAVTLKELGRHIHYARTVDLFNQYSALATGENSEQFLVMFNRREEPAEFTQRKTISVPKTPSVLAPAITQFHRTSRLSNIRRELSYDSRLDHPILERVRNSMTGFYGEGGVDEWIATIYDWVSLIDPNSYGVVEFEGNADTQIRPYPVVYYSPMVYETGRNLRKQLEYLLVEASATEYIFYAGEYSLRYTEIPVDKDNASVRATFMANAERVYTEKPIFRATNEKGEPVGPEYLIQLYPTKCPFVQAERLGYLPDPVTRFETCVSALEPAKYVLIDYARTGSNFDLTKYLHVMPQKIVALPRCDAPGCNAGKDVNGNPCSVCKGTGRKRVHTQPTDSIEVPIEKRAEDMVDLTKLIHYVQVELGTFDSLDKNLDKLKNAVSIAIFNNDVVQQQQVTPVSTATEFATKRDSLNNTLTPFADHKSSIYRFLVRCQAVFVSGTDFALQKLGVVHEHPKDLKPISKPEIYAQLQAAFAADAPPSEIEQLIKDLGEMTYEGDPDGLARYRIRVAHLPFIGLSWAQLQYLNASGYVRKRDMVLYSYQDSVFADLERLNTNFYERNYLERDKLITDYVNKLITELPDSALPTLNMGRVLPMPINENDQTITA